MNEHTKVTIKKLPTGVPGLDDILGGVRRDFLIVSELAGERAASPGDRA